MHCLYALVRKSSFSKAQGLRETGSRSPLRPSSYHSCTLDVQRSREMCISGSAVILLVVAFECVAHPVSLLTGTNIYLKCKWKQTFSASSDVKRWRQLTNNSKLNFVGRHNRSGWQLWTDTCSRDWRVTRIYLVCQSIVLMLVVHILTNYW